VSITALHMAWQIGGDVPTSATAEGPARHSFFAGHGCTRPPRKPSRPTPDAVAQAWTAESTSRAARGVLTTTCPAHNCSGYMTYSAESGLAPSSEEKLRADAHDIRESKLWARADARKQRSPPVQTAQTKVRVIFQSSQKRRMTLRRKCNSRRISQSHSRVEIGCRVANPFDE